MHRPFGSSSRTTGPYDRRERGGDRNNGNNRRGSSQQSSRDSGSSRPGGPAGGGGYGGRAGGVGHGGSAGRGGRSYGDRDNRSGQPGPSEPLVKQEVLSRTHLGRAQPNVPATIPVVTPAAVTCNTKTLKFEVKKKIYQYELKFKGFKGRSQKEEGVEIFRAANNDASKNAKYRAFNKIFYLLLENYQTFFRSDEKVGKDYIHLYAFDRSCLFYSSLDLLEKREERNFTIHTHEIPYEYRTFVAKFKTIEVRLVKTAILDVPSVESLKEREQRPILQFLDILFDQLAYKQDKFFVFGNKMFFKKDKETIWKDCYTFKSGIQKNVRMTEKGLALQIDIKHTVFYTPMPVLTYLQIMGVSASDLENPTRRKHIVGCLKGITVQTTHLENQRSFAVVGLSNNPARHEMFEYHPKDQEQDNERKDKEHRKKDRKYRERKEEPVSITISVAEYFEMHYKRPLKHPEFMCVVSRRCMFPLELLMIMPGQRVPREKMSDQLTAQMIKRCQTMPAALIENLETNRGEAGVRNNPIVKAAGIRINGQIEVKGEVIPKPAIVYKDCIVQLKTANWQQVSGFARSGDIVKMAIINAESKNGIDLNTWAYRFQSQARNLGLFIKEYMIFEFPGLKHYEDVKQFTKECVKEGFDLLLFLGDSKELHEAIKYSEIETSVVTQQIKIGSMEKGSDTIGNIIKKMNLKAGGWNHEVATAPVNLKLFKTDIIKSLLNDTVLIAIELCHPGATTRIDNFTNVKSVDPTCVGVAFSHDATASIQHGEYFLIPRRTVVIKTEKLSLIVIDAVKLFYTRMHRYPKKVLIYRGGISEGSFGDVIEYECGSVLKALQKAKLPLTVTMLVMQRKTNHRLFRGTTEMNKLKKDANCEEQNVASGTCIKSTITNPGYQEFIMSPQKPILGTVKPVVGTLIFQSTKGAFSLDQLIHLTHALCYQNEIITAPTTMPGLLRCASQLAQRGLNNWKCASTNKHLPDMHPSLMPQQIESLSEEQKHSMQQNALDRQMPVIKATINDKRYWA
uniref:Piwi domain-containing protein n=1 Tax=Panagrellus redivivus TaxID=6233 RepID=A0A7E4WBS1_PANRE